MGKRVNELIKVIEKKDMPTPNEPKKCLKWLTGTDRPFLIKENPSSAKELQLSSYTANLRK